MTLGDRLRKAREQRGLTQKQVSESLGLHQAALSLYECDRREPLASRLGELAKCLGVSSNNLLGLDEGSSPTARTLELKTRPSAYEATLCGLKPWEFRQNDRDFAIGDTLVLREWAPVKGPSYGFRYTGRRTEFAVTHIIHGTQFGIPDGYCIMTIAMIDEEEE